LHGVTGSGKTEIYLDAIAHTLAQGKQAIALIPEIALTPQTIRRFGARFGERIGILHSRLSVGERFDTWRRIRNGEIDVVIGPRSALLAPLPRLGIIVVDEEHDASYKSDVEFPHMPAYHAREVALQMARAQNIVVILGSATPDVETFDRARRGELQLLELPQRVIAHEKNDAPVRYQELPPVEIVDLRLELKRGNRSMFSQALRDALNETLARGEQAILFLNRRGTAQTVVCRDCGHVVKCPRCNNPYTLHTFGDQTARHLVCHHCGKQGAMPRKCPTCGSTRIRGLGVGTEKLEQAVRDEFPRAQTLRWDMDVTQGKDAHQEILDAFLRGDANVLIGTQMIAKGLDLPRVTLVGAVNADTGLFLPDFRAAERTFQLLTQVAGRAGRSALGGRAILQTYNPEHYAIQTAAKHAYHEFFEREMSFRRAAGYPPARALTRLLFTGDSAKIAQDAAQTLTRLLQDRVRRHGILDIELIGPAPAFFAKLRGKHRQHLLLKGKGAHELLSLYPLPHGWRVDVEPLDLL
jgi:primosomal protein N' (replication factor Y)